MQGENVTLIQRHDVSTQNDKLIVYNNDVI